MLKYINVFSVILFISFSFKNEKVHNSLNKNHENLINTSQSLSEEQKAFWILRLYLF